MKYFTSIAVLILIALPAHAQKPQIQWDEEYAFDQLQSFQWFTTEDSSLQSSDPFFHSLIVNTIEAEIAEGGLTEVQSDPDVYVTYHTASQDKVRLQTDYHGYGYGGYGRGGWGYSGYGFGGPTASTTRVIEYEEGTLVVDVWDAATETLVWRASVSRVFSSNVRKAEGQVVKAIEKMFKEGRKLYERANR